MVESLKKLTVSYGAFSCTLEGFDDPFPVMKQVVDYFQNLADRDPGFGAHPERPDADYLRSLAQQSTGNDEVEAEVHEGGVILRQSGDAAQAFAGMDVVEETIVVTPSVFQPSLAETGNAAQDVSEDVVAEFDEDNLLVETAESEDFDDVAEQPEFEDMADFDTPDLVEASEVADLIDADPLPETGEDAPQVDEMAELHADMERFDTEPVVDTTPVAAELPDILKPDWEPTEAIAPMFEDFPGVTDEDLAASEREVTEMALDTGDAPDITTMYIEGEDDTDRVDEAGFDMDTSEDEADTAEVEAAADDEAETEVEIEAEAEAEPDISEETEEKPKAKSSLVSKLPNWAAGLIRPAVSNDVNDDFDIVDYTTADAQPETTEPDMNGVEAAAGTDSEDAALERLLMVTQSRREEPDTKSETDALSEIREGILSMAPTPNPEWADDEDDAADDMEAGDPSETDDTPVAAEATGDTAEEATEEATEETLDEDAALAEPEQADEDMLAAPEADVAETSDETLSGEDSTVEAATGEEDAFAEDDNEIEAASVFDAETLASVDLPEALSGDLEKPVKVLEPLQLTTAFKVSDDVAEEVAEEVAREEAQSEDTETTGSDDMAEAAGETEDAPQDRSAFRLVHNRPEEAEETSDIPDSLENVDDDLSLAIFASKVGAASLPELLEASAAYTTIVAGQTRFSRRSIMGMLDEMGTERKYSQEARIKSFGKLIRSGTILRVEDGQFSISRSAKFNYEMKIGA